MQHILISGTRGPSWPSVLEELWLLCCWWYVWLCIVFKGRMPKNENYNAYIQDYVSIHKFY